MNNKVVTIVFIGLCLLLLLSVGGSFWDGSVNLLFNGSKNWKTPETLFVFWLGMSQAGVLLSVFLLIMNVKIHRRTSLLLELSSLCCLAVTAFYPLCYSDTFSISHRIYGIGIVGFISILFFVTHLVAADSAENLTLCKELAKIRLPLAWIMLPTVFWVLSSLCLDFTQISKPMWHGAFFPIYVVACVFYSGLAFLIALLSFENYYNRLMEKFLLFCSWFMSLLFFWMYLLKGEGSFVSFIFACAVPQLLFLEIVRENLWGRLMISLSIFLGIVLKCSFLVNGSELHLLSVLTFADVSLLFVGLAFFVAFFLGVRFLLARFFENNEILMGEVDELSDNDVLDEKEKKYYPPFSAPEFKVVRLPVLCGILVGVAYGYVTSDWIYLAEPIAAYVSIVLVCLQPFLHLKFSRKHREVSK